MILDIVSPGHPALRETLPNFNFANPPTDPIQLAKDLFETMLHNKGMGIAANQCGLPHRVFAIAASPGIVCFNPKIVDQTTEEVLLDEGCLTYPMLAMKVKRPASIKVRYTEPNGNVVTQKFTGMTARVFLHELDHLNGINFTQRANKLHVERAQRVQKALLRQKRNGK